MKKRRIRDGDIIEGIRIGIREERGRRIAHFMIGNDEFTSANFDYSAAWATIMEELGIHPGQRFMG